MLNTIIKLLKDASKIMLEARNIQDNTEQKGARNFVTLYDKKVQSFIKSSLSELYPDCLFIGEEEECINDPYSNKCFICDPIDGTANFRREYKHSAISLAYVEFGEVLLGAVIQPYTNELFYAEKGKGAFLNGNKISVSDNDLKNSFVSFGTSPYYSDLSQKTAKAITTLLPLCEDIRRTGSAALDLCYVANGRHDFFFEYSLFPWDYAAGSIIIQEAGGIITDMQGNKLPLDKRTPVIAGNMIAYKEILDNKYLP